MWGKIDVKIEEEKNVWKYMSMYGVWGVLGALTIVASKKINTITVRTELIKNAGT